LILSSLDKIAQEMKDNITNSMVTEIIELEIKPKYSFFRPKRAVFWEKLS